MSGKTVHLGEADIAMKIFQKMFAVDLVVYPLNFVLYDKTYRQLRERERFK